MTTAFYPYQMAPMPYMQIIALDPAPEFMDWLATVHPDATAVWDGSSETWTLSAPGLPTVTVHLYSLVYGPGAHPQVPDRAWFSQLDDGRFTPYEDHVMLRRFGWGPAQPSWVPPEGYVEGS